MEAIVSKLIGALFAHAHSHAKQTRDAAKLHAQLFKPFALAVANSYCALDFTPEIDRGAALPVLASSFNYFASTRTQPLQPIKATWSMQPGTYRHGHACLSPIYLPSVVPSSCPAPTHRCEVLVCAVASPCVTTPSIRQRYFCVSGRMQPIHKRKLFATLPYGNNMETTCGSRLNNHDLPNVVGEVLVPLSFAISHCAAFSVTEST